MKSRSQAPRSFRARMNPVSGAVALAVGSVTLLPAAPVEADGIYDEITVTATRREASVQDIPYNISAIGAGELAELRAVDNATDLARWVPGLIVVDQGQRSSSPMIMRGVSVDNLTFSEASGGNSNGNTVATYVGEVPVYIDLVLKDLERVEILRGPQGTLYGANSLAGAVRYIPARPSTDELEVDAHLNPYWINHSDDDSYNLDGMLNLPLGDKLAFRGVLSYEDRGGFVDQNYLVQDPGFSNPEPDFTNPADVAANLQSKDDVNDVETWYARASLAWDITDRLDALFVYHYQDKQTGGRQVNHRDSLQLIEADQGVNIPTGFYENGQRVKEDNQQENNIFELVVTADMDFAELTSATGYVDYSDDGQRDQTDLLLTFGYTYADFPTFTAFTSEKASEDTITQEFRLVSNGDGPWNWIGGFFYSDAQRDFRSYEFTPCMYDTDPSCPPGGAGVPEITDLAGTGRDLTGTDIEYIQDEHRESREWAFFGQLGYQFTDKWQATIGGRYFDQEDEFKQSIGFPLLNQILGIDPTDPTEQIALNGTKAQEDIDKFRFMFNTSYDLTDDSMAYFTFSQGYRSGGTNAIQDCANLPADPNVVCGDPNQLAYKPDESDNYEVGLRNRLLDGAMTLNLTLYYIDWDQVQVGDVSVSGGFPITINGDKAKSQGVELEFNYQITDALAFRGSYAYTDAQLRGDSPQLASGTAEDGDRLPGTPKHQGAMFLSYVKPLSADLDIEFDYGITAQSDVYTKLGRGSNCCRPYDGVTDFGFQNPDPALRDGPGEKLSGFSLHYAAVTVSSQRWQASLYAQNLWNEKAVTGVRADRTYAAPATGGFDPGVEYVIRRYFNYVLTPRIVGLDFSYKFAGID